VRTRTFRIDPGSPLAGKALSESGLRDLHGVSVLAVQRAEETVSNPPGDLVLNAGDVLFVMAPTSWQPDEL
jgi:K+/H+ antiporter YhaU regulatory subunit KhtT